MIILITLLILILQSGDVRADIFRYVDKDGVVCFTDTPQSKDAEIILRDSRQQKQNSIKGKIPRHLTATGIAISKTSLQESDRTKSDSISSNFPVHGKITSFTGMRHDPIDGILRFHNGVDIAVPSGTPVKPVATGRVIFSGSRPGYGNMVVIEHENGNLTLYAHNSVNLAVNGDLVDINSTIALSGSSGRSTGPHLHFEAWKNGINITPSLIPASTEIINVGIGKSQHLQDTIRRLVQADGTLLFTNLPARTK